MANAMYAAGKERVLTASINFLSDQINVVLVSSGYTPNLSTHQFYAEVEPFVLGSPITLTGKTVAGGAFDANDVVFAALPAGNTGRAIVMYRNTGVATTSPLIAYFDTITGFPVLTNGGDVVIQWDNGPNKIFSL